jgi:CHAT domain-containing protein
MAYASAAKARDSFIALAPDSKNDGRLTAAEIQNDPRPAIATLVVLSACQTGLGDVKDAEGTVGLQRALLARGVSTVMVSLWNVDDVATGYLVQRFFVRWLDPEHPSTKAEALRGAAQDLRGWRPPGQDHATYDNPRYWAAFQLVGAP